MKKAFISMLSVSMLYALVFSSCSFAWEYKVFENPMNDKISVLAYSVCTNNTNNGAYFVLRCSDDKDTTVYVKFYRPFNSTSKGNTEYVLQRIDKEDAKYVEWSAMRENNILMPIDENELLEKLANAKTFAIATDNPITGETVAVFDIANIMAAKSTIEKKCKREK